MSFLWPYVFTINNMTVQPTTGNASSVSTSNKVYHKKPITVLNGGRQFIKDYLGRNLSISEEDKLKLDDITAVREIEDKSALGEGEYKISDNVLLVEKQKGLLGRLRVEIESTLKEDDQYVFDGKERIQYSGNETQEVTQTRSLLGTVSEIMDRAFNRRTTLVSWALFIKLKSMGFKEDDFDKVKSALLDDDFVNKFTAYLKYKDVSPGKDLGFTPDEEKLANLAKKILNFYSSKNLKFVKYFPIAFSLQNVLMPFISKLASKKDWGYLNIFSKAMMIVNPWINEYSESLGNYFIEVKNLHGFLGGNKAEDSEQCHNQINLSPLTLREKKLNNIASKINEAGERLLGKGNTVSSITLNGILRLFGIPDYKEFSRQFVDNPDFIKKFAFHLEEGVSKTENAEVKKENKLSGMQYFAAKIIKGVVRVLNSMTPSAMKKLTNTFGMFYAIQNPLMPILANVIKEGPLSWVVHILRDFNPLINDLFVDHIANFRKEILNTKVETENEDIRKLFPEFNVNVGFSNTLQNIRSLWTSIREFARRSISSITGNGRSSAPAVAPEPS